MTAVAIAGPQPGSDVGCMKIRAVKDGNGACVPVAANCL